jgi:hypothetical protein
VGDRNAEPESAEGNGKRGWKIQEHSGRDCLAGPKKIQNKLSPNRKLRPALFNDLSVASGAVDGNVKKMDRKHRKLELRAV